MLLSDNSRQSFFSTSCRLTVTPHWLSFLISLFASFLNLGLCFSALLCLLEVCWIDIWLVVFPSFSCLPFSIDFTSWPLWFLCYWAFCWIDDLQIRSFFWLISIFFWWLYEFYISYCKYLAFSLLVFTWLHFDLVYIVPWRSWFFFALLGYCLCSRSGSRFFGMNYLIVNISWNPLKCIIILFLKEKKKIFCFSSISMLCYFFLLKRKKEKIFPFLLLAALELLASFCLCEPLNSFVARFHPNETNTILACSCI